jgi:hypothetical protein
MMDDILGFPVGATAGGEFTAICKYDARAGRIFRVERTNTGNGYVSENVDITPMFKAIFDLDNMQSGWIHFPPGSAPSLVLVPLAAIEAKVVEKPPQPSANHKNGVRFKLKLAKPCSGDGEQLREMAGTSNAFLNGMLTLYRQYKAERGRYPGQLPIVSLASAMPVTGTGARTTTNYQPTWRIDGWVPRPADLKNEISQPAMMPVQPLPAPMSADDFDVPHTAPRTGNVTVPPPNRLHAVPQANVINDDDFG